MRRKEKEITDRATLDEIIKESRVCRLGLTDGDQPYIVPLNFGYQAPYLYFHCATEGRKLDLIKQNPKVCFEFDELIRLKKDRNACEWGAEYRSIIGEGVAEIVNDDEEKRKGLARIMAQYSGREFEFPSDALERTCVIRVTIREMTGKAAG